MKKLLIAALAAGTALTAVSAYAQPGRHDDHDRGPPGHFVRHDDWRKGHRLGRDEWGRGQHIDYRSHHLRRPPRGYEWREVDGNYVLAAAATGVIASIIANAH